MNESNEVLKESEYQPDQGATPTNSSPSVPSSGVHESCGGRWAPLFPQKERRARAELLHVKMLRMYAMAPQG
ncbi:hypothetical protein QQF64_008456 [Cirrhinus molitorella]|uniref:Uncharacterized protein n=1 Tax=Cirrhinus molitorella TaxID=172907 RepID=A0ABR3M669_9TELE